MAWQALNLLLKGKLLVKLGEVYRNIGGPVLTAGALRTPGRLVTGTMRVVEWDVARSPGQPDGRMVTIQVRGRKLDTMRACIAAAHGLAGAHEVRQLAHWVPISSGFFEPLLTPADAGLLPDGALVVWSRAPAQGAAAIPFRGGGGGGSGSGGGIGGGIGGAAGGKQQGGGGEGQLLGLSKDEEVQVMVQVLRHAALMSRRAPRCPIPADLSVVLGRSPPVFGIPRMPRTGVTPCTAAATAAAAAQGENPPRSNSGSDGGGENHSAGDVAEEAMVHTFDAAPLSFTPAVPSTADAPSVHDLNGATAVAPAAPASHTASTDAATAGAAAATSRSDCNTSGGSDDSSSARSGASSNERSDENATGNGAGNSAGSSSSTDGDSKNNNDVGGDGSGSAGSSIRRDVEAVYDSAATTLRALSSSWSASRRRWWELYQEPGGSPGDPAVEAVRQAVAGSGASAALRLLCGLLEREPEDGSAYGGAGPQLQLQVVTPHASAGGGGSGGGISASSSSSGAANTGGASSSFNSGGGGSGGGLPQGHISIAEEQALVLAAAAGDEPLLRLFRSFALPQPQLFVAYARARVRALHQPA